jgi:hypothetical protein
LHRTARRLFGGLLSVGLTIGVTACSSAEAGDAAAAAADTDGVAPLAGGLRLAGG